MADTFDTFTERAKRVMALTQEEARGFRHNYIGTEHLVLALARETEGLAAQILGKLGVDETQLRDVLTAILAHGEGMASAEPGLTPRAKRALVLACDEARELGHRAVDTEHLLLGLIREEHGVAAGVLASLGVTLAQVRDQLPPRPYQLAWLRESMREIVETAIGRTRGRRGGDPSETKGNVITCRITDRDLAALDALVESGLRATRSDAAAWLIGAGVEAHRELFDRAFATIAQIRQLRAEAQAILRPVGEGETSSPATSFDGA